MPGGRGAAPFAELLTGWNPASTMKPALQPAMGTRQLQVLDLKTAITESLL